MNKDSLMLFIKRILESESAQKSSLALCQLKEILEMQGADPEMIRLISRASEEAGEVKEWLSMDGFSVENLKIAIRRADEKKRREEMMASQGRC